MSTTNIEHKELKAKILSLLPNEKSDVISLTELSDLVGLSKRHTKLLISELRKKYPICSKETTGGGYWITDKLSDVRNFINMIKNRRDGYTETMHRMRKHTYINEGLK
jgi:DNA-binding IscR family transcriptional regulator